MRSPTIKDLEAALKEGRRIMNKAEMDNCQRNLDAFSNVCPQCNHRTHFEIGKVFICKHRWEQIKRNSEFSTNLMNPMATTVIVEESQ